MTSPGELALGFTGDQMINPEQSGTAFDSQSRVSKETVQPQRFRAPGVVNKTPAMSRVIVAFVIFAAINLVWSQAKLGLLSAVDFPRQTWTGTAIEEFLRSSNQRARLAFLGSSLMDTPLVSVDADYLRKTMDAPYHHRSVYFEDRYKQLTGQKLTTFNFAIPGEMPSDAFLITKFLLKSEKRPDLIVYGVGPRDFLDNLLPNASATDPFKHLSRLGDTSDHANLFVPDLQERFNQLLGRMFFTYGHKEDLACRVNRVASAALEPYLPQWTQGQQAEVKQMVLPDYGQFDVVPSACLIAPTKPGVDKFKDNISEYRDRYAELKWDTFLSQVQFLGETMDLANERGIRTVLVAMPITQGNRDLISGFVWDLYKKNLRNMAAMKGATFVDMQAIASFNNKDFADTVHLNGPGGTKFLNVLAQEIAKNPAVAGALEPRRFDDESVQMPETSIAASTKEAGL